MHESGSWKVLYAGVLLLSPIICGCHGESPSARQDQPSARHEGSMMMPAAGSDGEFAAMMGKHHESAIEMARFEAQSGSRADVREMGRKIAEAQSAEHPRLEGIAREEGQAEHKSFPTLEEHSRKDMASLRAARGAEVDRQFLVHMMDHHAQGVDMARRSLPSLRREDLRRMAQKMIDDQTREIDQMQAMLKR